MNLRPWPLLQVSVTGVPAVSFAPSAVQIVSVVGSAGAPSVSPET
jgi:hypothetical protein